MHNTGISDVVAISIFMTKTYLNTIGFCRKKLLKTLNKHKLIEYFYLNSIIEKGVALKAKAPKSSPINAS